MAAQKKTKIAESSQKCEFVAAFKTFDIIFRFFHSNRLPPFLPSKDSPTNFFCFACGSFLVPGVQSATEYTHMADHIHTIRRGVH